MREIHTTGEICLDDSYGFTYHVAKIEYIEREDDSFRYIFTPNYSVIDLLGADLFQGIPGLDLDLRKERYIRENRIPVFISERSPSRNREDLWELLEACGMDYLNQLEWLVRTDTRYSGDLLYVTRDVKYDIEVDSIACLGKRSAIICRKILEAICAGVNVSAGDVVITDANRKDFYYMLMTLYKKERKYIDGRRQKGVKKAVGAGKYKGRQRLSLSPLKLHEVMIRYESGEMTGEQAAQQMGISRSTFMRRYREFRQGNPKSQNDIG